MFKSRCLGYSKKAAVTLVFCEALSKNQGRVAGDKGQISDNIDSSRLPVSSFY